MSTFSLRCFVMGKTWTKASFSGGGGIESVPTLGDPAGFSIQSDSVSAPFPPTSIQSDSAPGLNSSLFQPHSQPRIWCFRSRIQPHFFSPKSQPLAVLFQPRFQPHISFSAPVRRFQPRISRFQPRSASQNPCSAPDSVPFPQPQNPAPEPALIFIQSGSVPPLFFSGAIQSGRRG